MRSLLFLSPLLLTVACATASSPEAQHSPVDPATTVPVQETVDLSAAADPWTGFKGAPVQVQRRLVAERIAGTRLTSAELKACCEFLRSGDRRSVPEAQEGALRVASAAKALHSGAAWANRAVAEIQLARGLRIDLGHVQFRPRWTIPTVFGPLLPLKPLTFPSLLDPSNGRIIVKPVIPIPPVKEKPRLLEPGDCVLPVPR